MTDVQTVLTRATGMAGRRTVYWAGWGGVDPQAASPAQPLAIGQAWPGLSPQEQAGFLPLAEAADLNVHDPQLVAPACDCSGFVCWALGIARHPAPRTWLNTDTIWDDARGRHAYFRAIEAAMPGAILVYPRAGSNDPFGHIALVTETDTHGRATRIVHCSAANFRGAPADAIKITPPDAFTAQRKSLYAWFQGYPK